MNSSDPEAALLCSHPHTESGQQQRAAVACPSDLMLPQCSAQAAGAVNDLVICTGYTNERLV